MQSVLIFLTPYKNSFEMFDDAIALMKEQGVVFEVGLSDAEIASVQKKYNFVFPPDLRLFLQTALPVNRTPNPDQTWNNPFPDWRSASEEDLRYRLDWPLEGILFDVEHNRFWPIVWGTHPDALVEALEVARKRFVEVPRLLPVYGHRFIPEAPHEAGNPVFSVWQTDVIYYGYNLSDYLHNEFLGAQFKNFITPKRISFWSALADGGEF